MTRTGSRPVADLNPWRPAGAAYGARPDGGTASVLETPEHMLQSSTQM